MSDRASKLAPLVNTKDEFVVFLSALSDDFRANPQAWENNNLSSFIETLAAYAEDIDGYYKNLNLPVDASIPSWRLFSEILCGARVYE